MVNPIKQKKKMENKQALFRLNGSALLIDLLTSMKKNIPGTISAEPFWKQQWL